MSAIIQHTGIDSLGSGMTVLGEKQTRIPVGGKIRSGIMVLTAAGRQHPKAQGIMATNAPALHGPEAQGVSELRRARDQGMRPLVEIADRLHTGHGTKAIAEA